MVSFSLPLPAANQWDAAATGRVTKKYWSLESSGFWLFLHALPRSILGAAVGWNWFSIRVAHPRTEAMGVGGRLRSPWAYPRPRRRNFCRPHRRR